MITIKSIQFLPSEVVDMLRAAMDGWREVYTAYVAKINGSGTVFSQYVELEDVMKKYVADEPKDDQPALARYRGTPLTANCAMAMRPVEKNSTPLVDRDAIKLLMTTGGVCAGITNKSPHMTDPETGKPKTPGISVSEFYVNGPAGRRATMRTENTRISYYYSANHAFNTYSYQRVY